MRLLLVEDEKKVAGFIKKGLEEEGHTVEVAPNGEVGLNLALQRDYQVIVLDINLPVIDGLSVLQQLRAKKITIPVLLLTVRATIEDKVLGLDQGADDYLAKPFAFEELLARIRALARRRVETGPAKLSIDNLTLDPVTRTATRGARQIELTAREYALLSYFMRNQGRVLSRTMIADNVWGYDFDTETNVIDVYVNYLRNKIDTAGEVKLIHTVRGVGYVMRAE